MALDVIESGLLTPANDNPYHKIHFYFDDQAHATIDSAAELAAATASVKGDNAVATMAVEEEENVYITVQFASDYMETPEYGVFKAALENAQTAEMRDTVKTQRNTFSKSYHAAIIEENMPLLADIPYTAANPIDYSSFVTLTVPAAQLDVNVLAEVAENENILHLSLTDGFEVATDESAASSTSTSDDIKSWENVLQCIGAKQIVDNGTLTGSGVKIGVYETDIDSTFGIVNMCDVSNSNITPLKNDNRIHFRNPSDEEASGIAYPTHATAIVSILAIIAPDAEFYFTHVPASQRTDTTNLEGVSWFIEQGCDVVNFSYGFPSSGSLSGYRYDVDAVFDYQIYHHDIVVVNSAGNFGGSITSPGYAHNIITVGGVLYNNTQETWFRDSGSSYVNPTGMEKPEVCAPKELYIHNIDLDKMNDGIYEPFSGTSYSTALVTGCIAIFFEHYYQNVSNYLPASLVRSVVVASATKTGDSGTAEVNLNDEVGAGIVNLSNMIQSYFGYYNSTGTDSNQTIYSVAAGDTIQVAIAWNIAATYDTIHQAGRKNVIDFNVSLKDPDGLTVATSTYTENAVEYIRYTASKSGTYTFTISVNEAIAYPVQMGYAAVKIGV